MTKEDNVKWVIMGTRAPTEATEGGTWKIETVKGTERADHRVDYWMNKYKKGKGTISIWKKPV